MTTLGCHIEGSHLKVAKLTKLKGRTQIEQLCTLTAEESVKLFYNSQKPELLTISGLSSWEMLVRKTSFKLKSQRAVLSTLPYQIESLIPYPPEDLILLPSLRKKDDTTTEATLFATTSQNLTHHLNDLSSFHINPSAVSCTARALQRFAHFVTSERTPLLVFHIGHDKSSFILLENEEISLSHTASFGHAHLEPLQKELERVAAFLKKKQLGAINLLLTGEKASSFYSQCASLLEMSQLTLPENFEELSPYAIPIGLALDGLAQDSYSLQFQAGPYLPQHLLQKRGKIALKCALASLLVCAILSLSSWVFTKKRESHLLKQLQMISSIETSGASLDEIVEKWEGSFSKQKTPFPFLITAPSVSDTLLWASTHPLLTPRGSERIEIKRLSYQLVKYPTIDTPKEPYLAKVELEFTTTTPRLAREFRDALLAGDTLVNAKSEITWKANQNQYHTSFFLNKKAASP